ncbi:MAG: sodium:proton antiporter, partial [Flavobacteriales bacterium]|nr:sodium:proton antiporter [Flavobacteriales bacterium]
AGGELIAHIKHMFWTTGPSIIVALIVFLVYGLTITGSAQQAEIEQLQNLIETKFNISPWLFIVPILVIVMIAKKIPAIPALLIGSLLGALFAIIFQPQIVNEVSGIDDNYLKSAYVASINSIADSVNFEAENAQINDIFNIDEEKRSSLLKASGMAGMMNTVWLIICALAFGGAMQAAGLLQRITRAVLSMVNSVGSLIAATAGSCIFFNITASDQYIAIVVPGKMFSEAYADRGLAPENLSRTLEDSGTVTSVLIPWNTCGATQSSVMGVDVVTYAPYCIFNIVSPFMTVLFGFMGWKIKPLKKD